MSIIAGNYADRTVYLTLAGIPATGLMPSDIDVEFKKAGETTLSPKTLSPTTLIPHNIPGFYTIRFLPTEMDTAGSFFYTLTGPLFDNFVYDEFSVEPPANASFTAGFATSTQIQGKQSDKTIFLTKNDVPVSGILPSQIAVSYKKQSQNSLYTKTMNNLNWIPLSEPGYYTIRFSEDEMDTVGYFFYTIVCSLFDNFIYDEFTIEPSAGAPAGAPVHTCVLYGRIQAITGIPVQEQRIIIRPVAFPAKYGSTILSAVAGKTVADVYGNFTISLVRNSVVVIEIERTGIRHQITIPDQPQVELSTLLPPFAADYT